MGVCGYVAFVICNVCWGRRRRRREGRERDERVVVMDSVVLCFTKEKEKKERTSFIYYHTLEVKRIRSLRLLRIVSFILSLSVSGVCLHA